MSPKLFRIFLLAVTLAVSAWFVKNYSNIPSIFYGDAMGYYMYLPATFIYDNNKSIDQLPADKELPGSVLYYVTGMKQNCVTTPRGYVLNQYTYGTALMEAPFFFTAHAYEKMRGLLANGYSSTYENAIKISSVLYTLLGCLFIYYILRRFFTDTAALLTVVFIYLGTNLFWFTLYQQGMAHIPLFFLYALLIWLTIKIYEQTSPARFLTIGLVAGLITVTRPTDIICLLIPLLYNVYNRETLRQRILFLKANIRYIVLAAIVFAIPILPQLLYWKMLTGSYIFDSYGPHAFNWSDPRILEGLFYFSNGWLPYSPVMIFSLLGLFVYRYYKQWAWCIWLTLPIYIYVIYSWFCYNYINGLGSRPMIHLYPLLAITLAAFINWMSGKGMMAKSVFGLICIFFLAVNVSNSRQRALGMLKSEESNFAFNYQTLFRENLRYKDLVTYDLAEFQPDTSKLVKLKTLGCEGYNDSLSEHFIKDTVTGIGYVYHMKDEEYQPYGISITYSKKLFGDAKWFKCSGRFMYPYGPDYYHHLLVTEVRRNDEFLLWKACKVENKIKNGANGKYTLTHFKTNEWDDLYYFVKIPSGIRDGDKVKLDMWNIGKGPIYMDNICLELYK